MRAVVCVSACGFIFAFPPFFSLWRRAALACRRAEMRRRRCVILLMWHWYCGFMYVCRVSQGGNAWYASAGGLCGRAMWRLFRKTLQLVRPPAELCRSRANLPLNMRARYSGRMQMFNTTMFLQSMRANGGGYVVWRRARCSAVRACCNRRRQGRFVVHPPRPPLPSCRRSAALSYRTRLVSCMVVDIYIILDIQEFPDNRSRNN